MGGGLSFFLNTCREVAWGGATICFTRAGEGQALARSGRGGYHFFNISRGWQGAGATICLNTCSEVAGAGGNFIGILPGGEVGRWAKGPFSRGGKKYPKISTNHFSTNIDVKSLFS